MSASRCLTVVTRGALAPVIWIHSMSISRGRVRAGVAFIALAIAAGSRAAESGERLGAVVAARIEMQRQLGDSLTKSLQAAAEPYRIDAAVRLELRGTFHEVHAKQESASPAVKIGGKSTKVRLPGLGMVEGGGQGSPMLPEINIEGGTRVTESVSRQLETEVVKQTVLLYVDPKMPKDRRELLVRLSSDLADIDPARGDEIAVEDRPAGSSASPPMVAATVEAVPKFGLALLAGCATLLFCAGILAFGFSKRGAQFGATITGGLGGGRGDGEGQPGAKPGESAAEASLEAARARRREETGAFQVLADATPRELVQVISEVDPYTALAIVDLVGLDVEAAKLFEELLPAQRRVELGVGLAGAKVLSRDQVGQMEVIATQVLQRIRSRVALGGPSRLAEFLAQAPAALRTEVLGGLAAHDPELARAARAAMLLFENLPRPTEPTVRPVGGATDPATLEPALTSATKGRSNVLAAVSARVRSIIEAEESVEQEHPAEKIEDARRVVELAMRAAQQRGELDTRTPATTEVAA